MTQILKERLVIWLAIFATMVTSHLSAAAGEVAKAPFRYVWATAHHILPQTHNNESGYFSLVDGLDGKMYVGTTKYDVNSYLVEFDPKTQEQRIVIDTHKLTGQTATKSAAQAKIHTRNFVAPSGRVYCGSMHGHRRKDEPKYPGGYVMVYDPKTDTAEHFGIPAPGKSVIDVVADEKRGLIYAVILKPDNRWMICDVKTRRWRDLGPRAVRYGNTLIDGHGRANTITEKGFQLAQYDPDTGKVTVRDILVDGKKMPRQGQPTWRLAPDGRTSYLIGVSDPTLWAIDLYSKGEAVNARRVGKMVEGRKPSCKTGMDVARDGRVYAVVRVENDTGFGAGKLHRLSRYDPTTGRIEQLGVLAVRNPDFVDFDKTTYAHGYHTFPDAVLAPNMFHYALKVNVDGDVYVTTLYPFSLLRLAKME